MAKHGIQLNKDVVGGGGTPALSITTQTNSCLWLPRKKKTVLKEQIQLDVKYLKMSAAVNGNKAQHLSPNPHVLFTRVLLSQC